MKCIECKALKNERCTIGMSRYMLRCGQKGCCCNKRQVEFHLRMKGTEQKGKTMEQRLIDASAILNENGNSFKFGDETYYHESIIQNAPTVDAVQVVRCGECKHRKQPTDYCEKLLKAYVPDDFYCFYGKRKDYQEVDAIYFSDGTVVSGERKDDAE